LCFDAKTSPPMSKSLHKDILSTLKSHSPTPAKGNNLRRLITLACMICSCIRTKSCSLEGISSIKQGKTKQKESKIKQSSRWLSSKWTDCDTFFSPFARKILSSFARKGELVLVVDGSQTGSKCTTLMISVIFQNYAIPIAWLTKKGQKGHFLEETHLDLVSYVKQLIPNNCRVVLLADGEFDGLKLRTACKGNDWEFVLRTSTDRKVDCGGEIASLNSIYPNEGEEIVFLEDACDGDNAICWHNKAYEHPILLLTNMDLGAMACEYYRRRFKIETLFKYLKSAGFNLHKTKLESPEKIKNLIIVVAFAFIFTFSIGMVLKLQPPKRMAAFTRKDRLSQIHPITLAQKCLFDDLILVTHIFSQLSKNWDAFFT
jgi:hypothetical protein